MEGVVSSSMTGRGGPFGGVYGGRRVLVTGHTGFKGSWLARWLLDLGAEVTGYALDPPTEPSLFEALGLEREMTHVVADVRQLDQLMELFTTARPEVVFHLAAQPLVRLSYAEPVLTFSTNVMGTVNVLEAVRRTPGVRAVVIVTSDKCYENREWQYAYRENDPMGGHDPYSSSKGCAELVAAAYARAFFTGRAAAIATARAGNVIGGGDWATDRILPDCVRALSAGRVVRVRRPNAVRPWQHVLEPTSGYLWLGSQLLVDGADVAGAWNFGPEPGRSIPVRDLVEAVISEWGTGSWEFVDEGGGPHEALTLKLDCTKAGDLLHWRSVYGVQDAVAATARWYRRMNVGEDATALTREDISAYVSAAASCGVPWAAE
jgi:CDP-glucose 4,6-dehydratase